MVEQLLILGFLILLSGFFSGSETALFSLSNIKVHNMVENEVSGAKLLKKLKDNPHKLLTVLLIANNFVNIGASALATVLAIEIFGDYGAGIATGTMTLLVLVFGEITPKSIAVTHNEKISLFVAKPIWFIGIVLYPLVYIFENLTKYTTKIFSNGDDKTKFVSAEELETMATIGEKEGSIKKQERSMIHGVLRLDDKNVYQVMTPRNKVFSLNMNKRISEVAEEIMDKGYSRIPIYEEKSTNIKGIVYVKDILKEVHDKRDPKLVEIKKNPLIVPKLKKIDQLFNEFKKKQMHFAVVVDEHGDISGIVTIEDLIEEIVGEIYDETDIKETLIKKLNKSTFIIDGKAEISHIEEKTDINLGKLKDEDFETINGLIQFKTGKIPLKGEIIKFEHFSIEILESDDKIVKKIKLIKKK